MGMNSPGEIAHLCHIAEPNVVGVTFVGRGHLEGMGSVEKVALEKSQIYLNAPKAKKLFNMDNFYTKTMKEDYWQEGDLCFSKEKGRDIFANCLNSDFEKMSVEGALLGNEFVANLSVFGEHNVTNLMAAMGFASLCGLNAEQVINALPSVKMAWGRNQVEKINDLTVVFDAYNANPESMDAFLENASKQKLEGRKHLVLGEMLELGAEAAKLHEDLGKKASALGFDSAHFFGPSFKQFKEGLQSSGIQENAVISNAYEQSLALKIKSMLKPNDAVFIKASRGIRLERFLELLKSDT
jgi:UDP-N-acetylmuramoyl-tripeptide--D-alanyl-D-alanine ligase